ncbi:hypothetical protein PFICI_14063 [Pestalotiopsis fici W106-1]|uniref:Enoyl reductase (ER) domain-containing protein n=1 Tax=Pestalotiopsis fici (strain W106-1 / CGMCC3.15140) TaxID=1229662 RepID=W3WM03_PESFW|nr:uncharacterized protein PFICI_14063 [Pestalotiopsis fici W106-1]ETS74197.1 hypothetical protein PFICI_14063 [Pestalotiopsis fici W106-1]
MATMRGWQYTAIGELESQLQLVTNLPKPSPATLGQDQVLVKSLYASINPADRLASNLGVYTKYKIGLPAIPGYDFCGLVEAIHPSNTTLKTGDLVFGCLGYPVKHGTLCEYFIAPTTCCARVPDGVKAEEAAGLGSAAVTAYQALAPFIKSGQKVFINGGSGGVGMFAIQFAKMLGAEVTATCSTKNVPLCQELGATTIDYTQVNLLDVLKQGGQVYDHVVDNVGTAPELYQQAHLYTNTDAKYIQIGGGGEISAAQLLKVARNLVLPSFLGGLKRAYRVSIPTVKSEELAFLADWVAQGKVRIVIDQQFTFENTVQAFQKLKTGRARGKIIVSIS